MASTPPPAKKARVEDTEEMKPVTEETPKEAKPVLYSYWRSSCSWRVRIALAVKNVDYDYVAVNLLDGEQKSDEHVKNRNVMAQVPAFVVGDKTISQSMAILEYIEEKYEGPALLPKDLIERAQVREICNIIGSGIQPIQNLAVMKKVGADHGDKHKVPWNNYWITKGFEGLEILLAKTAGKYCFGDEVTLADAFLVPQIFNANRFKVDLEKFPIIKRIGEDLAKLDAFVAASPAKMPDATDA